VRAGTVEAQVAAFQAAYEGDVQPPATVTLQPEHLPMWRSIVRARARDEWSEIDKHLAANLTRCLCDIERISAELADEGDVIANGRGTPVANPKHGLLEQLSRRSVTLTKMLHLHAGAIVESVGNLTHKRDQEVTARENATTLRSAPNDDGDDLLARPSSLQ
jgi:hypothetical protein